MRIAKLVVLRAIALVLFLLSTWIPCLADDSSARFTYVQDGEISKSVHLPVYEWYPKSQPDGLVLCIHGLTLHGKRYEVLARTLAVDNPMGCYYVVAPDMRGFGRCRVDHTFCEGTDCKKKIDYNKSVDELGTIARLMRAKYPGVPLYVLGESLGATMCLAVASKYPDLVDIMVLSGPPMHVNPLMFDEPRIVGAGLWAILIDPKFRMGLNVFMKKLVSDDPNIVKEMINDPLIPKTLSVAELLKTSKFVGQSIKFARNIKPNTPVLILQGSLDKCVVPGAVVKLSENVRSSDQTMKWLYAHSHLLLETAYIQPATINAITNWFDNHEPSHLADLKKVRDDLKSLGGKSD